MLLIIQLVLYCLLFFLMVKAAVKHNGTNCLYFYPPAFIDEAVRRGPAAKDETMKRGKRFMVPFLHHHAGGAGHHCGVEPRDHLYSGLLAGGAVPRRDELVRRHSAMDLAWVAHGKEWAIPGMEGIPYIKPLKPVLDQAHRRYGPLLHHRPARGRRRCAGGEHLLTSRINTNRLPHYAAGSFSFN